MEDNIRIYIKEKEITWMSQEQMEDNIKIYIKEKKTTWMSQEQIENNIKIYIKEKIQACVVFVDLAVVKECMAFVNAVMNLGVS